MRRIPVVGTDRVFAFARSLGKEQILVVLNFGGRRQVVHVETTDLASTLQDLSDGRTLKAGKGKLRLALPARGWKMLKEIP